MANGHLPSIAGCVGRGDVGDMAHERMGDRMSGAFYPLGATAARQSGASTRTARRPSEQRLRRRARLRCRRDSQLRVRGTSDLSSRMPDGRVVHERLSPFSGAEARARIAAFLNPPKFLAPRPLRLRPINGQAGAEAKKMETGGG